MIEDNVDAGDSLAEVLELSGHSVTLARNGQSGLALARQTRPDVIVCDIGLPDIDGYQIARELRADESFRGTLLVALTGYAQPEDRKRAREAGFDEHFPKPPPLDRLNALLEDPLRDTVRDPIDMEKRQGQVENQAPGDEDYQLEQQFRAFVEMSPEIAWYLDPTGAATVVSGTWLEFTGRTAEQTLGYGYFEDVHPDDRPAIIAAWKAATRARRPYEIEGRVRRRDGVYRFMIVRGKPLGKEGTGPCAFIGDCTDITEQKEAEEELREAYKKNERDRAQLTAIFQAMSDGVFVFDAEGRLVFVNDTEAKLLGFDSSRDMLERYAQHPWPTQRRESTRRASSELSSGSSTALRSRRSIGLTNVHCEVRQTPTVS